MNSDVSKVIATALCLCYAYDNCLATLWSPGYFTV